jgi:hypothetical protein
MLIIYLYTEFHIPSYSISLITPVKLKTLYIFTQISYFCFLFQETACKLTCLHVFNELVAEQA